MLYHVNKNTSADYFMIETKYIDLSVQIEDMLNEMSDMDRLPGVTLLAKKFNSAPQTVSKALRLMSEKGKVTINGTKGTFVTKSARGTPIYKRIGILDSMEKGFTRTEKNSLIRLCEKAGYEHFNIEYNNANSKNGMSFISSLPADGFVLNYSTITPDLVVSLRQSAKQFVSVNQIFNVPGASWVDFDNEATIEKALNVLAALGRKRIALVGFRWGLQEHHEGIKNVYKKCMNKISIFDERLWYAEKEYMDYFNIYGDNANFELGKEAIGHLMKLKNPPDAMLVISAKVASGAYGALLNLGCKIPEDISLLLYSTGEEKQIKDAPAYSTIGYPQIRKVQRAIEILTELIETPAAGPIQELLPFNIKKGETT
jgi:DNA-binding LacI/PurR family transcriptional regulator